jgi:hypothetical protein
MKADVLFGKKYFFDCWMVAVSFGLLSRFVLKISEIIGVLVFESLPKDRRMPINMGR